jgi:precorrin-6A/cobalt-precorrin-6A reductase
MILLLGGTAETALLALKIAEQGLKILVSTATDIPLAIPLHQGISTRQGRLDEKGMTALIHTEGIRAIVDCTHPYADLVHQTARRVAAGLSIPCFTLIRPSGIKNGDSVLYAANHEEAACLAFSFHRPVLLTTGSQNLAPYVREASGANTRLIVRILPERDSLGACRAARIADENIIARRGPFSTEENRATIREFAIGVLVAKDSGQAGGTPEKIEAARREACRIIVVRRPNLQSDRAFICPEDLVRSLVATFSPTSACKSMLS